MLILACESVKPATLLKLTLLHGCFSRVLNGTNGTKWRDASHIGEVPKVKTKDVALDLLNR